ncbi:MAG: hypothetical protein E7517_06080 [Ruminococcaceae bacterium]|nr:hypothetical protein [Oscillospiraceae bacterium]
MKQSFKIAFGGILCAFCVILVLLGNIPMAEYIGPTFAGIILAWAVIEMGAVQSIWIYVAAAILSFLLSGNKEPALLYAMFFGYFPILRTVLQQKIRFAAVRWVIKFAVFNISMAAAYLLLVYVFGMPLEEMEGIGKYTIYVLLAGGNLLMVVVDFCIEKLSNLYRLKWQNKVQKYFKK